MRNQKQEGFCRRLFEGLEKRVEATLVHLVKRVDNPDAPAPKGRFQTEEAIQIANLVNGNVLLENTLVIHFTPHLFEVRMPVGQDFLYHRIILPSSGGIIIDRLRIQKQRGQTQDKPRLANAGRSLNKPGMMQPSAVQRLQELFLGLSMTDQRKGRLAHAGSPNREVIARMA